MVTDRRHHKSVTRIVGLALSSAFADLWYLHGDSWSVRPGLYAVACSAGCMPLTSPSALIQGRGNICEADSVWLVEDLMRIGSF